MIEALPNVNAYINEATMEEVEALEEQRRCIIK